jgi:hypothetical protein
MGAAVETANTEPDDRLTLILYCKMPPKGKMDRNSMPCAGLLRASTSDR